MKIAAIGVGGTGKTSVMKKVAKRLQLPFFPSTTREVYRRNNLTEVEYAQLTLEGRRSLQEEIFAERRKLENQSGDWVADRSFLDHALYYLLTSQPAEEEWLLIHAEMYVALGRYDHLFFFPMEAFWQANDGFRSDNYSQFVVLNSLMRDHLPKRAITVGPGSIEERVGYILRKIQ